MPPAKETARARGTPLPFTWQSDPDLYAPARYRRPCRYEAFVPEPLVGNVPALPASLAGIVSDAEARVHELNRHADPALLPLARLLLRTESIASSKVEGLQVDVRSLARAEARQETGARIGREAAEVLANVDAMQLAVEAAATNGELAVEHIAAVHHALLEGTNPRIAGVVRTSQNWIGGNNYNPCGADFVPPPADHVADLLHDLVDFCRDESLPPLLQAAFAHAQFETIHPFDDGNGRAGRALIQIILRRRGLAPAYVPPISVVLAAQRERYIAGLTAFREAREGEWVEVFAVSTARAAELASSYLAAVSGLQARWGEQLQRSSNPRSDAAAWALIDVLPAHPMLTTAVGVAATSKSRPTVIQAISQLVEAGVLVPLSDAQRNRVWEAPELIELLRDLEEGQAVDGTDQSRRVST